VAIIKQNSFLFNNILFCYLLHFILFCISLIANTHFEYIFFIGVLFLLFTHYHMHSQYHKLFVNIFTIFIIELANQIQLFFVIVLFIIVNVFFVPKIKTLFVLKAITNTIYSIVLYGFLCIYFYFHNVQIYDLFNIILINVIVDIFIVSVLF